MENQQILLGIVGLVSGMLVTKLYSFADSIYEIVYKSEYLRNEKLQEKWDDIESRLDDMQKEIIKSSVIHAEFISEELKRIEKVYSKSMKTVTTENGSYRTNLGMCGGKENIKDAMNKIRDDFNKYAEHKQLLLNEEKLLFKCSFCSYTNNEVYGVNRYNMIKHVEENHKNEDCKNVLEKLYRIEKDEGYKESEEFKKELLLKFIEEEEKKKNEEKEFGVEIQNLTKRNDDIIEDAEKLKDSREPDPIILY